MKQESMKVLFFIRKSRLKKNGEAPIFLRVTINGQLDEVRIQRSVPLKLWDNVKERSKGKDRSSTELNSYIEALKVRLYQIHKELLCREALITPKNLLIKLFSKEERHLVLQTMRKCIDDWTSLIGTEYQPSTISRYNNCYESLQTVIKDFYKKEDITFHELSGEFIDRFEMHLRTVRKLSQNTLTKYMSCFRKFLELARENGWLELDPLAGKRKRLFRKEETCPTFLTLEELKQIMEKDFSTTRLNTVKDFFLFCCLTGLSYIDVKTLCPAHLYKDNEGKLWIHKARVKITTHKESCTCNVPLLERKYSINSLVYWVTYVHNVVYSFYRSMIYCYINSTQRCAGSIEIDIIPTNGADKRKFSPFAPYFPVTNVIKRYFYPYFPAIIGIKGYSFPYFPYLSGIMKIKTALYSLFSRLDWHKTVVFPCLGEIYEGIRSLSWEIPVT